MASFTPSGVEFIAKGLNSYLGDLAKADKAQQNLGKSASSIGGHFATAKSGVASFSQAVGSSSSTLGSFVSSLGNMATVAGGIVTAQIFNRIAEGVGAFISTGFDAVDTAQRLETGLGALLTMNNLYERTTETMQVATMSTTEWAEAQAEAAKKSDDLAFEQRKLTADINTQNASIQEQRQRIIQMADGLDKNQQVARLQEMEIALEGMQRELAETTTEQGKLNTLTQEYTTVTKSSFEQTMGFAEAQKLAAEQSKNLLAFVEKLAIVSPFEQDQVAMVTKLATAAGLGVEETKSFTAGFLDLAAAVGIGSESLDFAADQLLQVAKVGKITTVDLRQLRRLGIDLEKILGVQMGLSVEEFNEKAAKTPEIFNDLFNAVTEFSQNTFAGTAERMATSLSGLRSTFTDIVRVGAKNMLRPLVEAVGPTVSEMLGQLSSFVTGPEMAKIGASIPKILFGTFESLTGEGEGQLFSGLKGLGLSSSISKEITEITQSISEMVTRIRAAFGEGGIQGAFVEFGAILGEVWTSTIQPQLLEWGNQFWDWLNITAIPLASQKINELAATVAQFLRDNWPTVQTTLTEWGNQFWGWVTTNVIPQIPTKLAEAINAVSSFLRDNWPTIQTTLNEWAGKFFDWVGEVSATIGGKMMPLLNAFGAWVTSPEASTKFNEVGKSIISSIFTGLANSASNIDELTRIAGVIANGMIISVAAIGGTLILVGAQIVAGIYSGILEALGIDLQPATIQELGTILKNIGNDIVTIAKTLGTRIVNAINDGLIATLKSGMKFGEQLKELMEEAKDILTSPEEWLEIGEMAMEGLQNGLEKASGVVLEYLKSLLGSFLDVFTGSQGLDEHSPSKVMMDIGKDAIMGLKIGAENSAGALYSSLGGITQGAIDALMTGMTVQSGDFIHKFIDDLNMGGIAKAAGAGGGQWKNFRNIIHDAIGGNMHLLEQGDTAGIMGIINREAARFHFPPQFAQEFAKAEGLIGHLQGTFGAMFQKMRVENLGSSVGLAGQFASIGSSFADMVKEMSSGFDEIREETGKLTEKNTNLAFTFDEQTNKMAILQEELKKLTTGQGQNAMAVEKVTESLAFGERQMAIYRQELEILRRDEQGNALDIEKKILAMDKLTETMDMQRQQLEKLQATNDSDALAIEKKTLAIEELTAEMAKNQEAIAKNEEALRNYRKELEKKAFGGFNPFAGEQEQIQGDMAMIELLKEFLAGAGQELRIVGEELGGIFAGSGLTSDIVHNRITAQEELNQLLAEQEERERAILELERSQKQLDFLNQQISLLKLLSDRGLNPADILGGMTLGLEAKATDLLEATNRVVTAMVEQINQDLQIHSPSGVMIDIFEKVMAGAVIGVERGGRLLEYAFSASVSPFLNMGQRTASPLASTYNNSTTNNFDMKVYTGANPAAVIRQYEVARSMV